MIKLVTIREDIRTMASEMALAWISFWFGFAILLNPSVVYVTLRLSLETIMPMSLWGIAAMGMAMIRVYGIIASRLAVRAWISFHAACFWLFIWTLRVLEHPTSMMHMMFLGYAGLSFFCYLQTKREMRRYNGRDIITIQMPSNNESGRI